MSTTIQSKSYVVLDPLKKGIEMCEARLTYLETENANLREQVKALEADAESVVIDKLKEKIASLEERLSLSYGEFASKKELKAFKAFEKKHMHQRATSKIQSGEAPYIVPHGTGIGTCFTVVCPICGEKKDITDVSCW